MAVIRNGRVLTVIVIQWKTNWKICLSLDQKAVNTYDCCKTNKCSYTVSNLYLKHKRKVQWEHSEEISVV